MGIRTSSGEIIGILKWKNDVPTAPFSFAVLTKESNTCASFCLDSRTRACQATDRDLEGVSDVKKMNAWICALLTTDHDLVCVIPIRKENL